jgi:hypothetical protein
LLSEQIHLALDGQPAEVLRQVVNLDHRRRAGTFFTNSTLRRRTLNLITSSLTQYSVILDPACGVGDLLVECTNRLLPAQDFTTTIQQWSKQLFGLDIYSELVQASKARLILAAIKRGLCPTSSSALLLEDAFFNIRIGNGLENIDLLNQASHILLNPPYTMIPSPADAEWTRGDVSMAAVFLDTCIQHAKPGAQVVAILPDVLRTGSRYNKWRKKIEEHTAIHRIDSVGQFDEQTDIDVFILHATVAARVDQQTISWWQPGEPSSKSLTDYFEVSVGPVVPYRDPSIGMDRQYIYAQLLAGKTIFNADDVPTRAYAGTWFLPPFVVIRRTTRPNSKHRAIGTVITGNKPVAVENHLIVLKPRNNSTTLCEKLLEHLDDSRTISWLNQRIRCRHFTVSSLRELPWWNANEPIQSLKIFT